MGVSIDLPLEPDIHVLPSGLCKNRQTSDLEGGDSAARAIPYLSSGRTRDWAINKACRQYGK